jgi:hypothetical protein
MLLLGQKLLLEKLEVRCKVLVNGLMNTCQPKKPQQDRYKQQLFAQFTVQIIHNVAKEPELNKAMVLLLARCWEYKLKTEDVLELTQVIILMPRRWYFLLISLFPLSGQSQNCIVYGSGPTGGRRDLLDRIKTAPETRTGQDGSMGTRAGLSQVR